MEQLNAKAKAIAEKIAAEVKAGKPLAEAAKGFPVQPPATLRRADVAQGGANVPEAVAAIFKIKPGEVQLAPGPNGNGYAILQVLAVKPGASTTQSPVYLGLKQSIMQYGSMEAQAQFVNAAREMAKVETNAPALKKFTQEMLGTNVAAQ
jgi:hypothetical protein